MEIKRILGVLLSIVIAVVVGFAVHLASESNIGAALLGVTVFFFSSVMLWLHRA